LTERGDALKTGQIIKARKIEDKLKELKERYYNKMSKPTIAYVIFNEEEAALRARKVKNKQIMFYDKTITFSRPPEPSNIIWENKNISKKQS